MNDIVKQMPVQSGGVDYPQCVQRLSQAALEMHAGEYLQRLWANNRSASRITDKLTGNYKHLGLISMLFPRSHVIHCRRDPMDTCFSIYCNRFPVASYTTSLTFLAEQYRWYQRMMEHWKNVLDLPILDISYEGLVERPEETVRTLLDFCGLEWEPACLRFHESRRFTETLSYNQVRQPLYSRSIGRWKPFEKYFGSLVGAFTEDSR